jgi:hypothetical protein
MERIGDWLMFHLRYWRDRITYLPFTIRIS